MGMTYRQVCTKLRRIMTFIIFSAKSYPYQGLQLNKLPPPPQKETTDQKRKKYKNQPLNKITYDHNTNIHRKKEINTWYYPANLKFTGN